MGQTHDLRCSKCGYGIKAMLGIGMLYSSENIFQGDQPILLDLVSDQEQAKKALDQVAAGAKIFENYGHELYACPHDFFLYDKFYFKVGSIEPMYQCPYGDGILERLIFAKGRAGTTRLKFIGQEKYWQCPRCGNDAMIEYAFENWD